MGGGAGGSEWLTPTNVSGTKWSAEWDFDADTVFFMYTYNGAKYIMLIDTTPSALYASSNSSYWNGSYTVTGGKVTWTGKRKVEIDFGLTLTSVSICPMVGKPNGYFA